MSNINSIGITQGQYGDHYPLVSPSRDIKYLIGDFKITYQDIMRQWYMPLSFTLLHGFGTGAATSSEETVHDFDIVIKDQHDAPVFDSRCWTYTDDAGQVRILTDSDLASSKQMYVDMQAASGTFADESMIAWFYHSDYNEDFGICVWSTPYITIQLIYVRTESQNYPVTFTPEEAVIDIRAVNRLPRHLLSIKVANDDDELVSLSGRVEIAAGYNTTLDASNGSIRINAVPGSGEGKAPMRYTNFTMRSQEVTEEPQPIKTINRQSPSRYGYYYFNADSCHAVFRKRDTRNTLYIHNSCTPCCKCEEFNKLGRRLNDIGTRYYCVGSQFEATRVRHGENVVLWNRLRACFADKPVIITGRDAICPYADIYIQAFNVTDRVIEKMVLKGSLVTTKTAHYTPALSATTDKVKDSVGMCHVHNNEDNFEYDNGSFVLTFRSMKPNGKSTFRAKFKLGGEVVEDELPIESCEDTLVSCSVHDITVTYVDGLTEKLLQRPGAIASYAFEIKCPADIDSSYDPTSCDETLKKYREQLYSQCKTNYRKPTGT